MHDSENLYQNIEKFLSMEESVYLSTREEFMNTISKQQKEYQKLNQQVRKELQEINNNSMHFSTILGNESQLIKAHDLDPLLKVYDERSKLLENQNQKFQKDFFKVSDSMNVVLKENRELRKLLNLRNKELDKLVEQFQDNFDQQKNSYEDEISSFQQQNNILLNEIVKLKTQNDLLNQKQNIFEQTLNQEKESQFSTTVNLKEGAKREGILVESNQTLQEQNLKYKGEINQLLQKLREHEQNQQLRMVDQKNMENAHYFRLEEFNQQKKNLEQEKIQLEKERKVFTEQENYLRVKEKDLQITKMDLMKLNKKHEDLKDQYFEMAAKFNLNEQRLEKYGKMKQKYENDQKMNEYASQQKIEEMKILVNEVSDERNQYEALNHSLKQQIEVLNAKYQKQRNKENQKEKENIKGLFDEMQQLKIQITYLKTEIQEKEYLIQKEQDELTYYRNNKGKIKLYDQMMEENQNLRLLLDEQDNENKNDQFLKNKQKIKNLLKKLDQQESEHEEEMDKLAQENMDLLKELDQLYQQNKELTDMMNENEQATNMNIQLIVETMKSELNQKEKNEKILEMFSEWYNGEDIDFGQVNSADRNIQTKDQGFQTEENFYNGRNNVQQYQQTEQKIQHKPQEQSYKFNQVYYQPIEERTFYQPVERKVIEKIERIQVTRQSPIKQRKIQSPETIKKNQCCQKIPCQHHHEDCNINNKQCTRFKCYCKTQEKQISSSKLNIPFLLYDNQFQVLNIQQNSNQFQYKSNNKQQNEWYQSN